MIFLFNVYFCTFNSTIETKMYHSKQKSRSGREKKRKFMGNQHSKVEPVTSNQSSSHKINSEIVQPGSKKGYILLDYDILAQCIAKSTSCRYCKSPTLALSEITDNNFGLARKLQIYCSTCYSQHEFLTSGNFPDFTLFKLFS